MKEKKKKSHVETFCSAGQPSERSVEVSISHDYFWIKLMVQYKEICLFHFLERS